jgi:ribose transport system permease protein
VLKSRKASLLLVIIAACIGLSILKPGAFLAHKNFEAIATGMIYDLLLASGMTLVLILGGIDLSVGSVLALTGVVTTMLLQRGVNVPAAVLLGFLLSMCAGAINGLCVARLKIAPFIVTLATMSVARGAALVLTSGYYVSGLPDGYIQISRGELLGVPYPIYIVIIVLIIFDYLLRNWKPLNQSFYIGNNIDAATMSGIRVVLITFAGYVICSLFAGIAAVFMTSRLAMGYSGFGLMSELRAIAAAVIGGASLTGGTGSVLGTCLGVLLLAIINNGFVLLHGSPNWQQVVSGAILIVAVGVDVYRRRKERKE